MKPETRVLTGADPLRVWLGPAGDPGSGPGDWVAGAPLQARLVSKASEPGSLGGDWPPSVPRPAAGGTTVVSRPDPHLRGPLLPRLWGVRGLKGVAGTPDTSLAAMYAPPGTAGPRAPVSGLCHTLEVGGPSHLCCFRLRLPPRGFCPPGVELRLWRLWAWVFVLRRPWCWPVSGRRGPWGTPSVPLLRGHACGSPGSGLGEGWAGDLPAAPA